MAALGELYCEGNQIHEQAYIGAEMNYFVYMDMRLMASRRKLYSSGVILDWLKSPSIARRAFWEFPL